MKNFDDFEAFIKTDGARVHETIVERVNKAVENAKIEDPVEEHVFYNRAFSELSVLEILRLYHEWMGQE